MYCDVDAGGTTGCNTTECPEFLFSTTVEKKPVDKARGRVKRLRDALLIYGARAVGWDAHEKRKKMRRMRHQTVVGIYIGQKWESGEALIYSRASGVTAHSRVKVFEEEIMNRDLLASLAATAVVAESCARNQLHTSGDIN